MLTMLDAVTGAEMGPWALVGNIGAAALVCTVWAYCFTAMAKQRKETAEEAAVMRREFAAVLTSVTEQFGARVEGIAQQVCASNERVEMAMRDLAVEMRGGGKRPT